MTGPVLLAALLLGRGPAAPAPPPGATLEVSVITAGAGARVWERWGHNMIRIRDRATGSDLAYNWGMFSFEQAGFVQRFLMGRMWYWMASAPTPRVLRLYAAYDRTLVEQRLDLTPAQAVALDSLLRWTDSDARRFYHYDYYRDNCSTRVRDALDLVLGGVIRAATDTIPAGTTFREETRRLSIADRPLYLGLMLGLGPATDRPISAYEDMFLPVRMMERMRGIAVTGPDGARRPLVAREDTLYLSTRYTEPAPAARIPGTFLVTGLLLGALLWGVGRRAPRWAGVAGLALAGLLLGVAGGLLAFLMTVTDHAVTYGNQNAWPLTLLPFPLAVLLRPAVAGKARAARWARGLAVAVVCLAAGALVVKLLPVARQDDLETLALLLPLDVGFALGVHALLRRAEG